MTTPLNPSYGQHQHRSLSCLLLLKAGQCGLPLHLVEHTEHTTKRIAIPQPPLLPSPYIQYAPTILGHNRISYIDPNYHSNYYMNVTFNPDLSHYPNCYPYSKSAIPLTLSPITPHNSPNKLNLNETFINPPIPRPNH